MIILLVTFHYNKAKIIAGGDFGAIFPDSSQPISKEIEDEANGYFQRIYNHSPHSSLPIDDVLEMLKRFQDSASKRERVRCH